MDPLWLFALLVFGIIVVPGMDMAFVLSSALASGRRAGLAAVAGIVAGGMAHVVMGTLGVGLLLQLVPGAFNLVLAAGAAYVAWLGWGLWRSPATLAEPAAAAPPSWRRTFLQAVATCLLNPKAYLFMVAVFPQFMRPERGSLAAQAVVLGAIICVTQALVYGAVAFGADGLRRTVLHRHEAQVRLARGVAALLIGTAVWTAVHAWRG
jgi:threonine/homoserine/homoserine lactone efflux protein